MSNGEFCCAVGICCPPKSPQQRAALVSEAMHGTGLDQASAEKVADWMMRDYDLAPKGTLDLSHVANAMKSKG